MFLDNVSKFQAYTSRLTIQKTTFLHIIPDFNMDVVDSLLSMDIGLNNCQSIYIKTGVEKFGNAQINPKIYYYKLKERQDIPVSLIQSLPTKIQTNKYIVIDYSILSQAIHQLLEKQLGIKNLQQILFEKIKENFLALKSKYPTIENVVLFNLNSIEDNSSLFSIIFNQLQNIDIMKCFDSWMIVAVTNGPQQSTFIPLATYDNKGNIEFLRNNKTLIYNAIINAIPKEIQLLDPVVDITKQKEIQIKHELADKVASAFVQSSEKFHNDAVYQSIIELDKKKLQKTLKNFQIKDPVVVNNIKIAVDQYIKQHPKVNREDIELIILKSIHFSLFGSEDIADDYLADPNRLISKLSEMNSFVKEISFPEITHTPQLVSPADIISINRITGLGRHKFELSQNLDFAVRNLFQSLENRKLNPIKVLKIKSNIIDNNVDRLREYTITVKNLVAGFKEPYELKLKIPALVNDYYFKLNGQNYILNNQMYLKPITKDKDSEARLLTHYNMVTLKINNAKFNTSQINDILNYIRLRYSQNCKNIDIDKQSGNVTKIEFIDGTIVEPASLTPFKTNEKEIIFDESDYKIHDLRNDKFIDLHIPKTEYIFQELLLQIQKINPDEKLNRSAKSLSYIQIHAMGRQMPFIVFLWQQLGLLEALTRHNINYEISEKPTKKMDSMVELALDNNKHLFIYPETKRQELLINGLIQLPKNLVINSSELASRHSLDDFINSKYGNRTTFSLDLMIDNIIDQTTKDLLEFEDQPTNFIDLINGPVLNKLLNDEPDHPADLKNLRLRQAEVLTNILYSEIAMSLNKYNTDLANGVQDAKLYFHPDYVTAMLLGKHSHASNSDTAGGILDYNVTFSPVDELVKASKTVKTGPGGVN
jgi:hypothetical protein